MIAKENHVTSTQGYQPACGVRALNPGLNSGASRALGDGGDSCFRPRASQSKSSVFLLGTISPMATLLHFTLNPVEYRGAAMPRGHFHSVTPP